MDDQPRQRDTGRRVVTWIVVAVIVVVLVLIGAQVIPRWWSHRVASVVDGSLTTGALFGLFIGFVFTVVPLILLALVIRYRREGRSWKGWIGWLLLVLITAAPNLMTLGIVLGRSSAAHAAERTFDVDAPGFRTWSLVGAIAGFAAVAALVYLVRTRGWFRDQNRRMRNELAERQQTQSQSRSP